MIAKELPDRLTGADLYSLCSDASINAIERIVRESNKPDEEKLILTLEDFRKAIRNFQPSVTESELMKYQLIKQSMQ